MNPVSAIGAIMSVFSMGNMMVTQGLNIPREMHPPQQQVQQQCPATGKLEVIITANGQRQLVCVEESK